MTGLSCRMSVPLALANRFLLDTCRNACVQYVPLTAQYMWDQRSSACRHVSECMRNWMQEREGLGWGFVPHLLVGESRHDELL